MNRLSYFYKFLLILIFSLTVLPLLPQETGTCAENLKTAQTLFDNGQVQQIPSTLQECLRSGFKKEEELAAYKLIIQTYLFEDRTDLADSAMLSFLKKNPEYQLSPTDHSSFVHLFNNFEVKPVLQLTLHLGTNIPFLTILNRESVSSDTISSGYSINALNFRATLEASFKIIPDLDLNVEAGYSQSTFKKTEAIFDFGTSTYEETIHRIILPVSLTYKYASFGKFTAYARGGAGAVLNLSSSGKALYESSFRDMPLQQINRNDARKKMDMFALAGTGIKLKTPRGYIGLEVRSEFGFFDQTVRGSKSAIRLASDYYYRDDDFILNNVSVTLGYTQIFFKPAKKK